VRAPSYRNVLHRWETEIALTHPPARRSLAHESYPDRVVERPEGLSEEGVSPAREARSLIIPTSLILSRGQIVSLHYHRHSPCPADILFNQRLTLTISEKISHYSLPSNTLPAFNLMNLSRFV
jgi:hypothetical protein